VPFDPTPIAAARAVALPWAPRADSTLRGDAGAAIPLPAAPAAEPSAIPRDRGGDGAPVLAQTQDARGTPWLMPAGAAVALLLLVTGAPAGLRALQRRRRLATGTAGGVWDELAATALDVGVRLEPSWTPRRAGRELAEVIGRGGDPSGDAAVAVARLARAEEVACYGPAGGEPDLELGVALQAARQGLLRSASRSVRLRALLWPASLVTGIRGTERGPRPAALTRLRRPRPV
jgi:hypothetical protein